MNHDHVNSDNGIFPEPVLARAQKLHDSELGMMSPQSSLPLSSLGVTLDPGR